MAKATIEEIKKAIEQNVTLRTVKDASSGKTLTRIDGTKAAEKIVKLVGIEKETKEEKEAKKEEAKKEKEAKKEEEKKDEKDK